MNLLGVTSTPLFRGSTVRFKTTFYDFDGTTVVQPASALVRVTTNGGTTVLEIAMDPPVNPAADPAWTAIWDTRGSPPSTVFWSIHTSGPPAVSVEDGSFQLPANPANAVTFP
jgi:hypothetical protein